MSIPSIQIADENLIAAFTQSPYAVELRDPSGRYLGAFMPPNLRPPEPEITEEELRVLENRPTGKWYTAAEVEAKLKELRQRLS